MRYRLFHIFLFCAVMAANAMMPIDSLKVSLVNFYPGEEIYELEGHTVLRLRWPDGFPGTAVSYGTYDFNQPNFVYRFVKGETDYWVTQYPWDAFEYSYTIQGRRVVEHPIVMDSVQKVRLVNLLAENLQGDNRYYRYNYVKDNCATRPLGILEKALGDSIVLTETRDLAGETTFRKVMAHYHANYPWYQFGIDLALGPGLDYPIDTREKAFAPVLLDQQLDGATVAGRPLSTGAVVLNEGTDATLGPTPWYLTPLFVCWLVFFLTLAISVSDFRRHSYSRWFDALLFGVFGIAGCIVAFLIFVSVHEASSPNWLFLWLNPACLLVPILIWLKKCKNIVLTYQFINFALILIMIVTWPFHAQHINAAFVPLICADLVRSASYIIYQRNYASSAAKLNNKDYKH